MNIAAALLDHGDDEALALLTATRRVTYHELRDSVRRVADRLLQAGRPKGDRVGVLCDGTESAVAHYLGVMRAGLVAVPLAADAELETWRWIIAETGMVAIAASSRRSESIRPSAEAAGVPLLDLASGDDPVASRALPPSADTASTELAALMYTSGSTGKPKGVMITHRNIECNTADIVHYLGLTADDRAMLVLPLHYCFGLSLLHTHLWVGASLVLRPDFHLFPQAVLRDLAGLDCTGFAGVPATYQFLLRQTRFKDTSFPRLRWLQQAGGMLPNAQIQELRATVPQARVFVMYGQTEATARLSYLPPEMLDRKMGSIGQGLPSTRLEVIAADGRVVPPGADETGEIVATGDNISLGYWNDRAETARFFSGNRLRTGDLGRVDADGYLYIVGRQRDMIKAGGNRVSAAEIEQVLAEVPAVVEAAVVSTPHELLGESIVAFVVLTADADVSVDDLRRHCRTRLAAWKVPREVRLVHAMPHNGSGKILKARLVEWAAATPAARNATLAPSPAPTPETPAFSSL